MSKHKKKRKIDVEFEGRQVETNEESKREESAKRAKKEELYRWAERFVFTHGDTFDELADQ